MTAARSDSSRISIALAGLQAFFLSEKMGLWFLFYNNCLIIPLFWLPSPTNR
jgi:hypothetical protein